MIVLTKEKYSGSLETVNSCEISGKDKDFWALMIEHTGIIMKTFLRRVKRPLYNAAFYFYFFSMLISWHSNTSDYRGVSGNKLQNWKDKLSVMGSKD